MTVMEPGIDDVAAAAREAIASLSELLEGAARRVGERDPAAAQTLRLETWIVRESLPPVLKSPR